MSSVDMHTVVLDDYRRYVQSFISISDPTIRSFVEAELAKGETFWPEALIQLNPAYRQVETLDELATAGPRPQLSTKFMICCFPLYPLRPS
jgi:hypothetical protein